MTHIYSDKNKIVMEEYIFSKFLWINIDSIYSLDRMSRHNSPNKYIYIYIYI